MEVIGRIINLKIGLSNEFFPGAPYISDLSPLTIIAWADDMRITGVIEFEFSDLWSFPRSEELWTLVPETYIEGLRTYSRLNAS
jgi:hypothetical protein